MRNDIKKIRDENISFYQDTRLLKNEAYAETLGPFNSVAGLVYIAGSAYFATVVKEALKTYQFVRQAGYESLGDLEVLEWAVRQTRSTFLDWAQIAIFVLSALMIGLVFWVSFVVKKYELYKHQRGYLLGLFGLAAAQMVCAAALPGLSAGGALLAAAPAALISLLFQMAVLIPQLLGSEMFYPLEFKNVSGVMKLLNFIVEFILKKQLDERHT